MPCDSSYMDPSSLELELQRTAIAELRQYALGRQNKTTEL